MIKKLFIWLITVSAITTTIALFLGGKGALYSTLIGYWSTVAIVLASFKSYQNMVQARLNAGSVGAEYDDRDTIDKLEDPYSLYDDNHPQPQNSTEMIKEEKKRLKRNRRKITQVAKDSKPAFSIYRVFAYALLVAGFFYLNSTKELNIFYYLSSIAIPIFIVVFLLVNEGAKN